MLHVVAGAIGRNFYNHLACRYGYQKEASEIQRLYLSGHKKEAEVLVPEEFLRLSTLVGPPGFVADESPMVAAPVQFGRVPARLGPAPELGADTDAVLAELGMTEQEIMQARIDGALL